MDEIQLYATEILLRKPMVHSKALSQPVDILVKNQRCGGQHLFYVIPDLFLLYFMLIPARD